MEFKESRGQVFVKNQGDRFLNLRMNESKTCHPGSPCPLASLTCSVTSPTTVPSGFAAWKACPLSRLGQPSNLSSPNSVATRQNASKLTSALAAPSLDGSRCSIGSKILKFIWYFPRLFVPLTIVERLRVGERAREWVGCISEMQNKSRFILHFARFALPLHKKSEEKQKSSADSGTVTYGNVVIDTAWAGQNTVAYYFWL